MRALRPKHGLERSSEARSDTLLRETQNLEKGMGVGKTCINSFKLVSALTNIELIPNHSNLVVQ